MPPHLDRGMGYIPDVPAVEDFIFAASGVETPDAVDLRSGFLNAIEDQLQTSSCTANACVSNLEYLIAQLHRDDPDFSYPELSRLFAYWEARKGDGLQGIDRGSSIRTCVDRLRLVGICEEALFPFDDGHILAPPPSYCYDEASHHRVMKAERLSGLADMQECLASGFPFVFGFQTYTGSLATARKTGVMPMPSGSRSGGHAVLAVGYDKASQRFIIRNSWGTWWGADGYYTMPFEYVTNPNMSSDWWTMQAVDWRGDVS